MSDYTDRFTLLPGLQLIADPLLASPGYRAWVRELVLRPRPELWEDRHWRADHLALQDGRVHYQVIARDLEGWDGDSSEAKLCLNLPLSQIDLARYRDWICQLPGDVESLLPTTPISLVGRGEDLRVYGGEVTTVPSSLHSLELRGTTMTVPLPAVSLFWHLGGQLVPEQPPLTAETLLVVSQPPPGEEHWSAPAVWWRPVALGEIRMRYADDLPPHPRGRPWALTEQYVVDTTDPEHPPLPGWRLWSVVNYNRFQHQVPHDEGSRALEEGELLPALRVLILLPGLEEHPWTEPPETIILPTVYWAKELVTRTLPECLHGYVQAHDLGSEDHRCLIYHRSMAKSARSIV